MNTKAILPIELGNNPEQAKQQLQAIKDAMAIAILFKIDATGITGANDRHYSVWQAIYLEADYQASTLT